MHVRGALFHSYTVDPVAMTQTNDATGYKRQVRALASGSVTSSGALSHSGPGQWQYKDDYGECAWIPDALNVKTQLMPSDCICYNLLN